MKIDQYSYRLGAADCFCEMVRAGVKKLALAHPCGTKEERDSFLPDFEKLCAEYGVKMYREDDAFLTDLFPVSMNKGKFNAIFYQEDQVLQAYLDLKAEKRQAQADGTYTGEKRRDIAWRYGKLLSYTDEGIERLLAQNQEKEPCLFLNGGGDGAVCAEAYARFGAALDKAKPLLYVPLAMEPEEYPGCLAWVTGELACLGVEIKMIASGEELVGLCLADFCGVFIGGGNTFTLLKRLKDSGAFAKLRAYLESGGPVFGGSAGAIIFGQDIDTCKYADENAVGLADTKGFDVLGGVSLLCHYGNEGEEITQRHTEYLLELSRAGRKIVALPEEDTILADGQRVEVMGSRPYALFAGGRQAWHEPGGEVEW